MNWSLQWWRMTKNKLWNKIWPLSSTGIFWMESRPKWSKTTSTSIIQLLSPCIKKYSSMLPRTIRPIAGSSKTIESLSATPWISIPFINIFYSNCFKTTTNLRRSKIKTILKMLLLSTWLNQIAKNSISSCLTLWHNFKSTSSLSLNSKIQEKMVNLQTKLSKWSSLKFTFKT